MSSSKNLQESQVTFEALGVHPSVCAALGEKGITHPLELQRKALLHTVNDFADVIAEAPAHSGRHTLLSVFAVHCVLGAPPKSNVVVIANSIASSSKILSTLQELLSSTKVAFLPCMDERPPKATSSSAAGFVYVGPLSAFSKWHGEHFTSTATLVVEDCAAHDPKSLQSLIEAVIVQAPSANLFLLSNVPPSEVNLSIRYLLRRKNRRYYFQEAAPAKYSYLMCHDAEDRETLNLKLAQLKGMKTVMILTHNKEVRDLKAHLHQVLGVKTFSIQRNTTSTDHDRVLSDYLRSQYAILVAMDAYTGVDLMDLDAVIQYYPPQKSMPEEEWTEYISYLQTTNDPRRPTPVITLVAPDDFSLVSYFMRRVGAEGPVINVSPTHPQFSAAVFHPGLVALEKMRMEQSSGSGNRMVSDDTSAAAAVAATTSAAPKGYNVTAKLPVTPSSALPVPRSKTTLHGDDDADNTRGRLPSQPSQREKSERSGHNPRGGHADDGETAASKPNPTKAQQQGNNSSAGVASGKSRNDASGGETGGGGGRRRR